MWDNAEWWKVILTGIIATVGIFSFIISCRKAKRIKKSIRLSVIKKPGSTNVRVSDEGKNWPLAFSCLQNIGETAIQLSPPRLVDDYGGQVRIVERESGFKVKKKGEEEDFTPLSAQTTVKLYAEDKAQPHLVVWVGRPMVNETTPDPIRLCVVIPVSPALDDGKKEIEIDYILTWQEWEK